jgi:hypothetical protein
VNSAAGGMNTRWTSTSLAMETTSLVVSKKTQKEKEFKSPKNQK